MVEAISETFVRRPCPSIDALTTDVPVKSEPNKVPKEPSDLRMPPIGFPATRRQS